MLLLSAALCSSTAFLSHQSDFSARVCFCSNLQASLYAAVVDLVLLVCNSLWWAWSLLFIRVCSSWSLGSNQSWCFLSGLPRYVLAVLYTTCCRAAHSSSGQCLGGGFCTTSMEGCQHCNHLQERCSNRLWELQRNLSSFHSRQYLREDPPQQTIYPHNTRGSSGDTMWLQR